VLSLLCFQADISFSRENLGALLFQTETKLPKRIIMVLLSKSWIVLLAGVLFAPGAFALQQVDAPKATPGGLFRGETTTVTVTAQVAADPALIPTSVTLTRRYPSGQVVVLGAMYDDGTHSDALAGDNIFTTQVPLSEASASEVDLVVTAAYRNQVRRVSSAVTVLPVGPNISDQQLQTEQDIQAQGAQYFDTLQSREDDNHARAGLVQYLKGLPGVANAGIAIDGMTVWIKFTSGLDATIDTSPPGTEGGVSPTPFVHPMAYGALFSCFQDDATSEISALYSSFCSGTKSTLTDDAVTVDAFKSISGSGIIYINAHGDVDTNGDVIITTGEQVTAASLSVHRLDLCVLHTIERHTPHTPCAGQTKANCYWAIRPSFIRRYCSFPQSIVYAGACKSAFNNSMANAFFDSGAKTYFGFDWVVRTTFDHQTADTLFNSLLSQNRTTQEAYNSVIPNVDQNDPNPYPYKGTPRRAKLVMWPVDSNSALTTDNFDEDLTFDDNQVPCDWSIDFPYGGPGRNAGVANDRFEISQVDTYAALDKPKTLPAGTTGVHVQFRCDVQDAGYGMGYQIHLLMQDGSDFLVGLGKVGFGVEQMNVFAGNNQALGFNQQYTPDYGIYVLDALFQDGQISVAATKEGSNTPLANQTVAVPDLMINQLQTLRLFGIMTTGGPAWIDDVHIQAIFDPLDSWIVRNPGTTTDYFTGVNYGKGSYVVVGQQGAILTSPDGATWKRQQSGTTTWLSDVAFGNNIFAIVGQNGTILTSSNGFSWTPRVSGTSNDFNRIRFLNGEFIAVGDCDTIATSINGITWTLQNSGLPPSTPHDPNNYLAHLYNVTYGNGRFVIIGQSNTILTSTDSVHWIAENISAAFLGDVGYGNGTFVITGYQGVLLTSPDGLNWTQRSSMPTEGLAAIAFGQGTFVSAGNAGDIFTSSDGISWVKRVSGTSNTLWNVAFVNNTFMAVGVNSTIVQSK
jgi:hypothetical protein